MLSISRVTLTEYVGLPWLRSSGPVVTGAVLVFFHPGLLDATALVVVSISNFPVGPLTIHLYVMFVGEGPGGQVTATEKFAEADVGAQPFVVTLSVTLVGHAQQTLIAFVRSVWQPASFRDTAAA
jgi:hypothetical protein